jgi:hypothetical protein
MRLRNIDTWQAPAKCGPPISGPSPSSFASEARLALADLGLATDRARTMAEINRELRGRVLDKRKERAVETLRRCLK